MLAKNVSNISTFKFTIDGQERKEEEWVPNATQSSVVDSK